MKRLGINKIYLPNMKCILYAHELYTLLWRNLICPLRIEAAFSGSPKFPILLNIFFFNFLVVFRSLDWDSHEDQNLGPASQVTHQACTHLKTLILRVTELERLRGGGSGLVAISLVEKKQPLVERERDTASRSKQKATEKEP